jgi:hypothetical protein
MIVFEGAIRYLSHSQGKRQNLLIRLEVLNRGGTVVSGQINSNWEYLQINQISISSKTDNMIYSF